MAVAWRKIYLRNYRRWVRFCLIMSLIKKPMKKRHRVIRDPLRAAQRKAEKKQIRRHKLTGTDQQEVSRVDRLVMQFNTKANAGAASGDHNAGNTTVSKSNRKKRNRHRLDTARFADAAAPVQPGMNKPEKPLLAQRQRRGETDVNFMRRLNQATKACPEIVEQSKLEEKYGVDVWQGDEGHVRVKPRKLSKFYSDVDQELVDMKHAAYADPGIRSRVKFSRAVRVAEEPSTSTAQSSSRKRLESFRLRKKLKRLGFRGREKEELQEDAPRKDMFVFGQVVDAPPLLQHRPRKAAEYKTNRPGRKDLLLKKILCTASGMKKEASVSGHSASKSASLKGQSAVVVAARARELEEERDRVMDAYRCVKKLRGKQTTFFRDNETKH
ncbi:unnamed protein product [Notodromas monacha]|uniref:Uncharacterized protein n=1 Tax=Notodromas monacha TaxID=399045 RepID=A0A7R9BLR2_9CRUS|nr:unnamed protein product [Notodromas monacha]CAG0917815.1 unnamed protein product [Notodromas monacha]